MKKLRLRSPITCSTASNKQGRLRVQDPCFHTGRCPSVHEFWGQEVRLWMLQAKDWSLYTPFLTTLLSHSWPGPRSQLQVLQSRSEWTGSESRWARQVQQVGPCALCAPETLQTQEGKAAYLLQLICPMRTQQTHLHSRELSCQPCVPFYSLSQQAETHHVALPSSLRIY